MVAWVMQDRGPTNPATFTRVTAALVDRLHLAACRTTAAVKDLGNANTNTPLYSPLPFHVLGNGAGFFPQLQVSTLCKASFAAGVYMLR